MAHMVLAYFQFLWRDENRSTVWINRDNLGPSEVPCLRKRQGNVETTAAADHRPWSRSFLRHANRNTRSPPHQANSILLLQYSVSKRVLGAKPFTYQWASSEKHVDGKRTFRNRNKSKDLFVWTFWKLPATFHEIKQCGSPKTFRRCLGWGAWRNSCGLLGITM